MLLEPKPPSPQDADHQIELYHPMVAVSQESMDQLNVRAVSHQPSGEV